MQRRKAKFPIDKEKKQIALILKTLQHYSPVEFYEIQDRRPDNNALKLLENDIGSKKTGRQIMQHYSILPGREFPIICHLANLSIITPRLKSHYFTVPQSQQLTDQGFIMQVTKQNFMLNWFLVLQNYVFVLNAMVLRNAKGHLKILQMRFDDSSLRALESLDERGIIRAMQLYDVKTGKIWSTTSQKFQPLYFLYDKLFIVTELLEKPNVTLSLFRRTPNMINPKVAIVTDSQFGKNALRIIKTRLPHISSVVLQKSGTILKEFLHRANVALGRRYGGFVDSNFRVDIVDENGLHLDNVEIEKISKSYFKSPEQKTDVEFLKYYGDEFPTIGDEALQKILEITKANDLEFKRVFIQGLGANIKKLTKEEVQDKYEISRDLQVKQTCELVKSISYSDGTKDNRSLLRRIFEQFIPSSIWGKLALGAAAVGALALAYQYWNELLDMFNAAAGSFSLDAICKKFIAFYDNIAPFLPVGYSEQDCRIYELFDERKIDTALEAAEKARVAQENAKNKKIEAERLSNEIKDSGGTWNGTGWFTSIGTALVGATVNSYNAVAAAASSAAEEAVELGKESANIAANVAGYNSAGYLIMNTYNTIMTLSGGNPAPDMLLMIIMSAYSFSTYTSKFLSENVFSGKIFSLKTAGSIAGFLSSFYALSFVVNIGDILKNIVCTIRYFTQGNFRDVVAKLTSLKATNYAVNNPLDVIGGAANAGAAFSSGGVLGAAMALLT